VGVKPHKTAIAGSQAPDDTDASPIDRRSAIMKAVTDRFTEPLAITGAEPECAVIGNPNRTHRVEQPLTRASLARENVSYHGTGGVSESNRCLSFRPAFIDRATGTVYRSRFADGRLAPCHLVDGLPAELVLARNEQGRVTQVKSSVVSGFVRGEHFYTRAAAAALVASAAECDSPEHPEASARAA
jgi:hypothetical protein